MNGLNKSTKQLFNVSNLQVEEIMLNYRPILSLLNGIARGHIVGIMNNYDPDFSTIQI